MQGGCLRSRLGGRSGATGTRQRRPTPYSNSRRGRPDNSMMCPSVPRRTVLCSGTGTVAVAPSMRRCMIAWLPRRRTSLKPCRARIAQTSRPDRTRSLANDRLNARHVKLIRVAARQLLLRRRFQEARYGLLQIGARLSHRPPLAGRAQLGAERHVPIILTPNDRRQLLAHRLTPKRARSIAAFRIAPSGLSPHPGGRLRGGRRHPRRHPP